MNKTKQQQGNKLLFNPITSATSTRPKPKPKSKPEERLEKDKRALRIESEVQKVDPLNLMTPEELSDMAMIGLSMYLKSVSLSASESGFQTVIRNIKRLGLGRYVDDSFKPCLNSLVGENLINRSPWRAFVWLSPSEFVKENPAIFGVGKEPNVSPDDVEQGLIGDGYLIASLASLAEKPNRIVRLFALPKDDRHFSKDHGVYAIKIFLAGHPFELVLDDYFPCISKEKGSAFAKVIDGKLWPLMIEKAWAKLYFNYDNIEKGIPTDVLRDLTGAPGESLWMEDDVEGVWKKLVDAHKMSWPMTAGSKHIADQGIDYINEVGIVSDHTYCCLGGFEVQTSKGEVRLVKMRSVWKEAIYKGKWSTGSPEWNDVADAGKYLGDIKNNPKVFFIEYEDFQKHFLNVQLCYMNDDFKYSYETKKFNRKIGKYFKITIKKEGVYFFTVSQEPLHRYSKTYRDKFDYADVKVVLARVLGENQYEYVSSTHFGKKDVWISHKKYAATLPAGEYVMYAKIFWPGFEEKDATISVYGADSCRIDHELNFTYGNFLEKVWLDYALKNNKDRVSLKKEGAPNSFWCCEKTLHGFGYIVVSNHEQDKKLHCELRLKNPPETHKVKFKGRFNKFDVATFDLLPGKSSGALVGTNKYYDYGDPRNTALLISATINVVPV